MNDIEISFDGDGAFVTFKADGQMVAYFFLSRPALDEVYAVLAQERARRRPVGDPEEIQGDA